jgi:hypothetical protein
MKRIVLDGVATWLFEPNAVEVLAGEVVTISETHDFAINWQVATDPQVFGFDVTSIRSRETVTPDKIALRNATVVLPRFIDLARIVFQVVQ